MTEGFVAILKKLIADRGIGVLDDARICRSFLFDYGNEHKREIKLFTKALESNFQEKLRNSSNRGLDKKQMAKHWHDDEGIDIKLAGDILNCLSHALFGDALEDADSKESVKVLEVVDHVISRFTETTLPSGNTFTDSRDGQVYRAVKIGSQIWMAQNLNYNVPNSKCYNNDLKNAEKYGRLYDWKTAREVIPPSWHLPTDAEWQMLVDFVGGSDIAGNKLKSYNGWRANNNGTNDYGFSALPGGRWNYDFDHVGFCGFWWSSTNMSAIKVWVRNMDYSYSDVFRGYGDEKDFFSVRCLKNES